MIKWIKKLFNKIKPQPKTCLGCRELAYYNDGSAFCSIGAEHICFNNDYKLWKLRD